MRILDRASTKQPKDGASWLLMIYLKTQATLIKPRLCGILVEHTVE